MPRNQLVILALAAVAGVLALSLLNRRRTAPPVTTPGTTRTTVESPTRPPPRILFPPGTIFEPATGQGLFIPPRPTRGVPLDFTQPVFRGIDRPFATTLIAQKREFDAAPTSVLAAINPLL